jgi:hypothetical protein
MRWHKIFKAIGKYFPMQYLLLLLACIVAYPILLVIIYIIAKTMFVRDEESEEWKIKQKMAQLRFRDRSSSLTHG